MRTMNKTLLLLALLLPGLAFAGRPLSTEDASTLDDKACQLEAWVDRTRGDVTDTFVVPACALFNTEFQFGVARTREEGRYLTLWGVAIEKPVTERLTLLAEAFGENTRDPFIRAGGRFTLFDKFDIDLTYVTRSSGEKEDRYWSLGFHWERSPLLP